MPAVHRSVSIIFPRVCSISLCVTNGNVRQMKHWIHGLTSNMHYYLVNEFGGGDLLDFVVKAHDLIACGKLCLTEWHKLIKLLFAQMLEAVEYIHEMNVCHFDISVENVVLDEVNVLPTKESGTASIKFVHQGVRARLIDFGLAHYFGRNASNFRSTKHCGKARYQSPEIVARKRFCGKSNDVWCLGVCLFMMTVGVCPWETASASDPRFMMIWDGRMMEMLKSWGRERYVDELLVDLMNKIFQSEKKRATLQDIKMHSWWKR